MIFIVGLGNPIPKYLGTRHNVGQAIVSYFQKINNFPKFQLKKKLESLISEGKIDNKKIILVLPQNFMNNSGLVIQKLVRNWKLEIKNLIVVHDDLDLPLGKIRIKKDGSSGGHKGVQSIIDCLKTQNFIRIKIGIANEKRDLIPVEKFVLEKFDKEEKKNIKKVMEIVCEIISNFCKKGELNKVRPATFKLN